MIPNEIAARLLNRRLLIAILVVSAVIATATAVTLVVRSAPSSTDAIRVVSCDEWDHIWSGQATEAEQVAFQKAHPNGFMLPPECDSTLTAIGPEGREVAPGASAPYGTDTVTGELGTYAGTSNPVGTPNPGLAATHSSNSCSVLIPSCALFGRGGPLSRLPFSPWPLGRG